MLKLMILTTFLASFQHCEESEESDYISVFAECDTTVALFVEALITIPCSYRYLDITGDDSYLVRILSDSQDIVMFAERGVLSRNDTIRDLPKEYKLSTNRRNTIIGNGEAIGVIYYKNNSASFRNVEGYFLLKEGSYYLELLQLSYASNRQEELIEVLSTVQLK